jgi:hypothetical protein
MAKKPEKATNWDAGETKDMLGEPLASGAWETEDLDKLRYTAGKLDENGIRIVVLSKEQKEGKNGTFTIVRGTVGGKDADLVFSSEKLTKIFEAHWDEMLGQEVQVSGHGVAFERQYHVALVQKKVA